MSVLTKEIWQVCTIFFVLLLPYVVLRRQLWFPGMVTMAYGTFAYAKLPFPIFGLVRIQILLFFASLIIIYLVLYNRVLHPEQGQLTMGQLGRAPAFLVFLLFLMLLRFLSEYILTGFLYFYPGEMKDLAIGTLLPCLIVLIYPARENAFVELLQGIALGAFLSLLPAFADFKMLSIIWNEFNSHSTIHYLRVAYRDKNTIASWAIQGGIALLYLGVFKRTTKGKRLICFLAVCLAGFAIFTQSRRWMLGLAVFWALIFWFWVREGITFFKTDATSKKSSSLPRVALGIIILFGLLYMVFRVESRFEALAFDIVLTEIVPSRLALSSISRLDLIRLALDAWKEHPVLGVGLSGFGWKSYSIEPETGAVISRYIGSHNLFTDILLQNGIVGIILSIIFLLGMFHFLRKWLYIGKDESFRRQLIFLIIYWVSLFPVALTGGWAPQNLGLLALLPCVGYQIVKNYATRMGLEGNIRLPKHP